MEASRITFTKETKDKMESGLNITERGKLRWSKIEELYSDGRLQKFKNRNEVAAAVGFMPEQKTRGYGWVTNMINRGYITEVAMGVNRFGSMEYQYFLTNKKPDYSHGHGSKKTKALKNTLQEDRPAVKTAKKLIEPVILSRASTEKSEAKITITKGDIVIAINEIDNNILEKMIIEILRDVSFK